MKNPKLRETHGKTVVLKRPIRTTDRVFPAGSILHVGGTWRGRFTLELTGEEKTGRGWRTCPVIRHVHRSAFVLIEGPPLHFVWRLPAMKTVVAIYAHGRVNRDDFHAAVIGLNIAADRGWPVQDLDAVYHERWKLVPGPAGPRLKRCPQADPDGHDVTAIDVRRWSRGRRPA